MDTIYVWAVILGLGLGTFVLRYSFLGVIGSRSLPEWVHRHLRYTAVTMLPALVAPAAVWPAATDGAPDPARMAAALATLVVGMVFRSAFAGILGGALVLAAGLTLLG